MSQSKSDDNWVQDAVDNSCGAFQLTREQVREMKMLRRKGFKEFADAYYDYFQLEKTGEFWDFICQKRDIAFLLTGDLKTVNLELVAILPSQ